MNRPSIHAGIRPQPPGPFRSACGDVHAGEAYDNCGFELTGICRAHARGTGNKSVATGSPQTWHAALDFSSRSIWIGRAALR